MEPDIDTTRLDGKVAVVTGGGRNIGRACALRLASRGAAVTVADLDAGNAGAVAREITSAGGRAIAVELDIASLPSIEAMASRVVAELGSLDILVNNAAKFSELT